MEVWTIAFTALGSLGVGWLVARGRTDRQKGALQAQNESLTRQLAAWQAQEAETQKRLRATQEERENHRLALSRKEVELAHMDERQREAQRELEKLQEKFSNAFENLANRILEQKSEKFTHQNKTQMEAILSPLKERIKGFEEKVEKLNEEHISRNEGLREQLLNLRALNEQITQEAHNLTQALRGDRKTQGHWGELVLERILERSGLEKGREFEVQQRYRAEDGTQQQPDVILHLPEARSLVIDAKVSLTAYERWCNETDDSRRASFLKQHLASLEKHVKTLSDKNYHMLYEIKSPEFVLMFVPLEPALAPALSAQHDLYYRAFARNIVIVTPSSLLATLRTINSLWQQEKRRENAEAIARQAGALYDKFKGFAEDLITLGKRIDGAKYSYENAMNKLSTGNGNLVRQVEKLRKMGAKTQKKLPPKLLNEAEEDT